MERICLNVKYLISGHMPFEHEQPFPPDELIVERNYIGYNVGNLFFFNAVIRSLYCEQNEIVRFKQGIDRSSYDAAISIRANDIFNGQEEWFETYYRRVSRCDSSNLPVVLICVGSDSDSNFKTVLNPDLIEKVRKCYDLILRRSKSIGVRGEMSKKVLTEQIGIPEDRIDVIGCPSVRYFGKNFIKSSKDFKLFSDDFKIAVNFTAYCYDNDEAIYLYNILKKYNRSFVIFTDKVEAELLWYNNPVPPDRRHDLLPTMPDHFILKQDRAWFSANQQKIMKMLSTVDFSIGSRIHQAVISILSGCPTMLIAHSIRVLEIAQHHKIPYILRSELVARQPSVEELYYRACLGMKDFYDSYDEKLKEYTNFLQKNGLIVNPDFIL